ncbi:MAG: hypothetical protein CM1200mP16_13870 [Nitrospina sp.]|nr:MAG: hypothetical protein CM1200mP16_13870 [Nitrospina sp.]
MAPTGDEHKQKLMVLTKKGDPGHQKKFAIVNLFHWLENTVGLKNKKTADILDIKI